MSSNQPGARRRDTIGIGRKSNMQLSGKLSAQQISCNVVNANSIGTRGDATQETDINTGVSANGRYGVLTLEAATTAAGGTDSFVFTNAYFSPVTSVMILSLEYSDGSLDGIPLVEFHHILSGPAKVDGQVLVTIRNIHASAALNAAAGDMRLHYQIMGPAPDLNV